MLDEIGRLNRARGKFSPPGRPQRLEQEERAERDDGQLRSVLIPLFGTGQGGAAVSEVIGPMLTGLLSYLDDRDNRDAVDPLREIFISAYTKDDVDAVVASLDEKLTAV